MSCIIHEYIIQTPLMHPHVEETIIKQTHDSPLRCARAPSMGAIPATLFRNAQVLGRFLAETEMTLSSLRSRAFQLTLVKAAEPATVVVGVWSPSRDGRDPHTKSAHLITYVSRCNRPIWSLITTVDVQSRSLRMLQLKLEVVGRHVSDLQAEKTHCPSAVDPTLPSI